MRRALLRASLGALGAVRALDSGRASRAFQLREARDPAAGHGRLDVLDDLLALARVTAEDDVALGGFAFGEPTARRAGDVQHAVFFS
jgi:hypothetical protein